MTNRTTSYELVCSPTGQLLQSALDCESEIFLRTFGNTKEQWAEEYGDYEDASHFLALADDAGEAVGVCRVITPSPAGLKTVNDVARPPWQVDGPRALRASGADPARTWDVATIAVRPDSRVTPLASAALYHGLVLLTRANDVRWIVMMLDERARRLLAIAGFVARPIPGTTPAPYLGSAMSTPLVGDVAAMIDGQRRTNPDAYRLITLGVGMTGIEIPPLDAFVISSARAVAVPDDARELAWIA